MFELVTSDRANGGSGFLGLWAARQLPSAETVSFASMAADDGPLWRVDLPADAGRADALLAGAEAVLSRSPVSLAAAGERLAALIGAHPSGTAFGIALEGGAVLPPEADLLQALRAIGSEPPSVSFGQGEPVIAASLRQRLHAFVTQLQQAAAHYAWVETQIEGQLLGRTVVSWGGDHNTLWREGIGSTEVALHHRALELAVASRAAWLRMIGLAAWGAVQLTAALTTPGGALLVLPAVWKFLNQVQEEVARMPGLAEPEA